MKRMKQLTSLENLGEFKNDDFFGFFGGEEFFAGKIFIGKFTHCEFYLFNSCSFCSVSIVSQIENDKR